MIISSIGKTKLTDNRTNIFSIYNRMIDINHLYVFCIHSNYVSKYPSTKDLDLFTAFTRILSFSFFAEEEEEVLSVELLLWANGCFVLSKVVKLLLLLLLLLSLPFVSNSIFI